MHLYYQMHLLTLYHTSQRVTIFADFILRVGFILLISFMSKVIFHLPGINLKTGLQNGRVNIFLAPNARKITFKHLED